MKPFYSIGYQELLASLLTVRTKRLVLFSIVFLSFGILSLLISTIYRDSLLIFSLFALGVISMLPLRFVGWCGFFDMNTLLTVYASMEFGLPAGLFVGTASVFGIVFSGDIDNNIFFDLGASYFIAVVASLFTLSAFLPVVFVCAVAYFIAALTFHTLAGTLEVLNAVWTITNFIWVLFVLFKLLPLFGLV